MNEQLAALQLIAEQAGSTTNHTREELDGIVQERDSALTSLNAAQKQIDHIIRMARPGAQTWRRITRSNWRPN